MALKQRYKVHHSSVLDASPDAVWAEIRDVMKMVKIIFGGALVSVEWVEDGALDRVPARYNFTVLPGHELFQQQVERHHPRPSMRAHRSRRCMTALSFLFSAEKSGTAT